MSKKSRKSKRTKRTTGAFKKNIARSGGALGKVEQKKKRWSINHHVPPDYVTMWNHHHVPLNYETKHKEPSKHKESHNELRRLKEIGLRRSRSKGSSWWIPFNNNTTKGPPSWWIPFNNNNIKD